MVATQGYSSVSRRALDIEDYIDIARRHAVWIVGPTYAGLVIAIIVAFIMPSVYESRASMQITPPQISESLVHTTLSQQMSDRISFMQNMIRSRGTLSGIIQSPRLDLYKKERLTEPLENIIETMNKAISITTTTFGEGSGKKAVAFDIRFSYPDRYKAQLTVTELVAQFQDANTHAQQGQQELVKGYIKNQEIEAKANLDRISGELAKFETDNADKLRENVTLVQIGSADAGALQASHALEALETKKGAYERDKSFLKANMELAATYQDPVGSTAVVAENRQNATKLASYDQVIENQRLSLAIAMKRLRPNHPDIKAAQVQLDLLVQSRDALALKMDDDARKADEAAATAKATESAKPRTQTFQARAIQQEFDQKIKNLDALIQDADRQEDSVRADLEKFKKNSEAYNQVLKESAGVQASYNDLLRDKKNAEELYQIQYHNQQLTDQNSALLSIRAGENLEILDSASLPTKPIKPNRWLIVGAGFAISLFVGMALAAVQEAKDTSLKNLKDVRAYTNLPVLCSVPLLENTLLVKRKRRLMYLAWSAAVIIGAVAVAAAVFYYYQVTGGGKS